MVPKPMFLLWNNFTVWHCWNQCPSRYPVNTHIPTTSTPKPPIPAPFGIFETVRHPHGLRPTKPVIRVPTWMKMATSALPALSDEATAKSAPPLHPAAPVQCHCRQLVCVSPTLQPLQLPTIQSQLFHVFPTHISNFQVLLKSFSFPSLFFSCFSFS